MLNITNCIASDYYFLPIARFDVSTVQNQRIISSLHQVSLKVFDVLGREVARLVDEYKQPGNYNFQFSIINYQLPSGVYYYRLQAGNTSLTKKMLLLK